MDNKRAIIGAHVSAAGGLWRSIENAQAIGAECLQIFGSSPRQWLTRAPKTEDVEKFKRMREESRIGPTYLHGAYLPNLAAQDPELFLRSIRNLSEHLEITEMLGAEGLIFHLGSGKEAPREDAKLKAVTAMKEILKNIPGKSFLIMENSAGGGAKLGSTASELGEMMRAVDSSRIKVCIDTAHAFSSGAIEDYTAQGIARFIDEWDGEVGLENIVALHINDSKAPAASRRDLHENIGEGTIGIEGFKRLAKEKRLWGKAWILEVPGFAGTGPDKKNVDILKSCFLPSDGHHAVY